jgi:uncharacterized phosphosugar-binding protein
VHNGTEDGEHSASVSEDEEKELGMSCIVQLLAKVMSDFVIRMTKKNWTSPVYRFFHPEP